MSLKQKRYRKIFIITAMVASLTAGVVSAALPVLSKDTVSADKVSSYEAAASVVVLAPVADAHVTKELTVQFYTEGLQASQYEPFWSVDNGKWNRMEFAADNPQLATTTLDVSGWNWHKDSTYTLTLTALIKGSWKPVQTTVTFHIDTPAAVAAAAAATAAKQAATTPVAATAPKPATQAPVQAIVYKAQALFTDTQGETYRYATAAAANDRANAGAFNRLANVPVSTWYGDWTRDVQSEANNYVSRATTAGQVPSIVAYNIPGRDCGGGYSAGGTSDSNYLAWIRALAAGIGQRSAIVILEPDALADMDCLSASNQANRTKLLSDAVNILQDGSGAQIYLDAGNPGWISAATMAKRLNDANVGRANGFALNVSNFFTNDRNVQYGNSISAATGGKHFVIDTSRNGNGPTRDNAWCNPAGRAVGQVPTLQTASPLVDALLWVKGPGGSDGSCTVNGTTYPSAGTWVPSLALELIKNAGY